MSISHSPPLEVQIEDTMFLINSCASNRHFSSNVLNVPFNLTVSGITFVAPLASINPKDNTDGFSRKSYA